MNLSIEEHRSNIREHVRNRLIDLGILDQLPSVGMMRIIEEEIVRYYEMVAEEENEDPEYGNPPDESEGRINIFTEEPQGPLFFGYLDVEQDALYTHGHKVTIGARNKVLSFHDDGSECQVPCRCRHPDVRLVDDDEGSMVYCDQCGRQTKLFDDKFKAVVAWLTGGTETHDPSA